jgi:asparagine synthase (glutamine-hydrolysing)
MVDHEGPKTYAGRGQSVGADSGLQHLPSEILPAVVPGTKIALGHRRLSIIDLSSAGHQPMCDQTRRYWITFNGEIYNYLELRDELRLKGYSFFSDCDTEVVLAAYSFWGEECVHRFNGMWAFCIYDSARNLCFMSRDRLGVKPFYYLDDRKRFAFASEQKAFVKAGLLKAKVNEESLHDYLLNSRLEKGSENFFEGLNELLPGHNLFYDLRDHSLRTQQYYHLSDKINSQNDSLSQKELIQKIRSALFEAVRLRMRSDVPVGTCLSGGIDSSVLALIMSSESPNTLSCFTSVFPGKEINEEKFAGLIAGKTGAKHYKVEPRAENFFEETDTLVYSQDVPIWDTSTYAQFKVMELASENNVKVVLDGQGADELFGGYHHHFIARWQGMLAAGQYRALMSDLSASKKTFSYPLLFWLRQKIKSKLDLQSGAGFSLFSESYVRSFPVEYQGRYTSPLNNQLLSDIYDTRLKSFLKCEDRCGMWHSVESRTSFSDDLPLMELMFSFDDRKKISDGISKFLLREAMKSELPSEIYNRYDKKGFDTPMKEWIMRSRKLMTESIAGANLSFADIDKIQKADLNDERVRKMFFRLFIFSRWKQVFR